MPTEIHDRNEVRRLIEAGFQVVDVLGADEYEDAHLPGDHVGGELGQHGDADARLDERDGRVVVLGLDGIPGPKPGGFAGRGEDPGDRRVGQVVSDPRVGRQLGEADLRRVGERVVRWKDRHVGVGHEGDPPCPGRVLSTGHVDGTAAREAIVSNLFRLADEAARTARGKVLSPPFTIVTTPPNAVVGIDDSQRAVRRLQALRRTATVQVVAAEDTRTIGPLTVRFVVLER